MRLVTVQDIFVKRQIEFKQEQNKKPIYTCDRIFFESRDQDLFNRFIEKMKQKLDFPKDKLLVPIWCWVIPKDKELTDELMYELIARYMPKCQFPTIYELEVPNDGILISNFDIWSSLMFKNMLGIKYNDDEFNKLFERQKGATIQACIPFIHADFIKYYKQLNSYRHKEYTGTEKEIEKLLETGSVTLDGNGYIDSMTTDDR